MDLRSLLTILTLSVAAEVAWAQSDAGAAPPKAIGFRNAPVLQAYAQAADSHPAVTFRGGGDVDVKAIEKGVEQRGQTAADGQKELDDLTDQKQTLESEIRYAKSKLDAAQRKLAAQTAANNSEQ